MKEKSRVVRVSNAQDYSILFGLISFTVIATEQ